MSELQPEAVLDGRTAAAIAAGMRAVSLSDGRTDPREQALIAAFEHEIPEGLEPTGVLIRHPVLQALLLRSMWFVAWADGAVGAEERTMIYEIARGHGIEDARTHAMDQEVRHLLLEALGPQRLFSEAAARVALELGIEEPGS